MLDPSPPPTSPARTTRSASKQQLSASDSWSDQKKIHQIPPPPVPIDVDVPIQDLETQEPTQEEPSSTEAAETIAEDQGESRTNGAVNGADSNREFPASEGEQQVPPDTVSQDAPEPTADSSPEPQDPFNSNVETTPVEAPTAQPASRASSPSAGADEAPNTSDSSPSEAHSDTHPLIQGGDSDTPIAPDPEPVSDIKQPDSGSQAALGTPGFEGSSIDIGNVGQQDQFGQADDPLAPATATEQASENHPESQAEPSEAIKEPLAGSGENPLPSASSPSHPPLGDVSTTTPNPENDTTGNMNVGFEDFSEAQGFDPFSLTNLGNDDVAENPTDQPFGSDGILNLSETPQDLSKLHYLDPSSSIQGDMASMNPDFISANPMPEMPETSLPMIIDDATEPFLPINDDSSTIPLPANFTDPTATGISEADIIAPPTTDTNADVPSSNDFANSISPQTGAQLSPSWAPTLTSDGEGTATNNSASAVEPTSSSPTALDLNKVDGETTTDSVAAAPPSSSQKTPPLTDSTAFSQAASAAADSSPKVEQPSTASTTTNPQVSDSKSAVGSPSKLPDVSAVPAGNPKVALILSLNQELIKICVSIGSAALGMPTPPEIQQYQERLSSNLNWLASVADNNQNPSKPSLNTSALPMMQPPKPLPPSVLTMQCGESLAKLPALYAKLQEVFKTDYERKMRRDAKLRVRAMSLGQANTHLGIMGAPSGQILPPPGAAMPVAGVKRDREGEGENGDRKRLAMAGMPMEQTMSSGGSPTRPTTARAASLSLSSTQSPVISGQSPLVPGGIQMPSTMPTPRMSSTGFGQPIAMPTRNSPQHPTAGNLVNTAPQTSPTIAMSQQQQQQRQPSLPPSGQQLSPTQHQAQQMQGVYGQGPGAQSVQQGMHAGVSILPQQANGPASGMSSPQRPPSVTSNQSNVPFPSQGGFQAPGSMQRQPMMGNMSGLNAMNGPGVRNQMSDDQQRALQQQQQIQLRQHMGQQPQGTLAMQPPSSAPSLQQASGGSVGGQHPSGGAGGLNQQIIQQVITHLQNPSHPITQQLHRMHPNFSSLPPNMQVHQFHALHMRLVQQQQQQQAQQAAAAGALPGGSAGMGAFGSQPRPPSAAGSAGGLPPGVAGLRNLRQGTASPRISGATGAAGLPQQGLGTVQRQPGLNGHMNAAMPNGLNQQMTAQQRQMMMMQQQQALNRMGPGMGGSQFGGQIQVPGVQQQQQQQSSSSSQGTPNPGQQQSAHGGMSISPINRQQQPFPNPSQGGQGQQQQTGMISQQWTGGAPGGYVNSPLNRGWSPQTAGVGGSVMSAPSPVSSGGVNAAGAFHMGHGQSPAQHSESGTTPRHSGMVNGIGGVGPLGYDGGNGALGGNGDQFGGGIDPSALFNEWTTSGNHGM